MPIEFRCQACGKLLRTGDDTAGKQAKCPECGAVMAIPAPDDAFRPAPTGAGAPSSTPFGPPPSGAFVRPAAGLAAETAGSENPYRSPAAYGPPPTAVRAGEIRPTRIDFSETLSRTWAVFTDRWLSVLGAALLMLVVLVVGNVVMFGLAATLGVAIDDRAVAKSLNFSAQFASNLLSFWLGIGLQLFCLGAVRGEEPRYGLLFAGGRYLLPLIGCSLLTAAIVLCGLVLLIVPGFIFAMMLIQAQLLILDRNLGVLDALSESRRVMAGNKLTALGIWLVAGILGYLFAALTCGLGVFAFVPYMLILNIVIYLSVTGQSTLADLYAPPGSPFAAAPRAPQPQGQSPFAQ